MKKNRILIILIITLLSGCGNSDSFVTEKGIRLAYDICKDHGGLMAIQPHTIFYAGDYYDGYPVVICEDLLVVDLNGTKEKRDAKQNYGNIGGIVNE
jgi:hypothetical protein